MFTLLLYLCKKIGPTSVNDFTFTQDLHAIHTTIETYKHNTGSYLLVGEGKRRGVYRIGSKVEPW
jgi:hypothetical protein